MHELLNFYNEALLRQALTHRSYANEHPGEKHNERLEFLGDALLTFISGEYLYTRYQEMGEDEMTRRRSALVDEKQLAKFAIEVGLDSRMRLGRGAMLDGGRKSPNLLSSTFESVVGAYYLDRDRKIEKIRPVIEDLFNSVPPAIMEIRSQVQSKNQLQEWVQVNFGSLLPKYDTKRIGGEDHAPEYLAKVLVGNQLYGTGKGRGKKEAEKQAAENALSMLKKQGLI
ncbi:ribonuclease III [Umezakia ovalisporum]|jgi:ribonuclease-3|uniref:Ribonuclease 3 n=2 Tax=Umezakia ovalisporum TaxID=75695 RepID=A0AA43GWH3_9CYAN|nr:ribonuclease III [Umezakia ovalisporum]MBI1242605.1 ribonuclease III [Nostoc sp. RI_552]MDH6057955.1 ribonuclease III [Umezakia ovalisporum FSS-43]MDH6063037.1 ribonuclease III [Umezakia ovalisporum FSS-62]MDH6066876.1 ribonuclease III [Umezakia ovalisporum APH033B]MDH6071979.1 ribonuclease III [Umezakia ovalisporum CobakiLakeA]